MKLLLSVALGLFSVSNLGFSNDITGSWENSKCVEASNGQEAGFFTQSYNYIDAKAGRFSHVEVFHLDPSCTVEAFKYEANGALLVTSGDEFEGNVELIFDRQVVTPSNEAGVQLLNTRQFCGVDNWFLNDSVGVDGEVCLSTPFPSNGESLTGNYKFSAFGTILKFDFNLGERLVSNVLKRK